MLSFRICDCRSLAAFGVSLRQKTGGAAQPFGGVYPAAYNKLRAARLKCHLQYEFPANPRVGLVLSTSGGVPLFFPIVGQMCVCIYRRHQLPRAPGQRDSCISYLFTNFT